MEIQKVAAAGSVLARYNVAVGAKMVDVNNSNFDPNSICEMLAESLTLAVLLSSLKSNIAKHMG